MAENTIITIIMTTKSTMTTVILNIPVNVTHMREVGMAVGSGIGTTMCALLYLGSKGFTIDLGVVMLVAFRQ